MLYVSSSDHVMELKQVKNNRNSCRRLNEAQTKHRVSGMEMTKKYNVGTQK